DRFGRCISPAGRSEFWTVLRLSLDHSFIDAGPCLATWAHLRQLLWPLPPASYPQQISRRPLSVNWEILKMRRSLNPYLKISASALLALVLLDGSALAKIKVIQSSTPGLEENLTLSETEIVEVPKDAAVTVLQTPECRALEIKGPYRGTIADYLQ